MFRTTTLGAFVFTLGLSACKVRTTQAVSTARSEPASTSAASNSTGMNAWLEINRSAFEGNIRTLRALVGNKVKICAIMKADAYGHGVSMLTPSIIASGISCIGIASNEEAAAARARGYRGVIARVRTAALDEVESGIDLDIEELIGNLSHAKGVAALAQKAKKEVRFHLALNSSGMSRNGLELKSDQGKKEVLEILQLPGIRVVGIMTHFPVEEREDMLKGLATFKAESTWVVENAKLDRSAITLHCANSYATLEVPETHLDMVRPGGAIYGDTVPKRTEYQRVLQFKSRVAAVNRYPAGNTVAYDRTFTLTRDSLLANIPAGYSDGYRRAFSNKGYVLIRGRKLPIVGRVTMNTFMVDVTEAPEVSLGDEVVLFGKQGNAEITQTELEKGADTILADLYTIWGSSNPRVVVTD